MDSGVLVSEQKTVEIDCSGFWVALPALETPHERLSPRTRSGLHGKDKPDLRELYDARQRPRPFWAEAAAPTWN